MLSDGTRLAGDVPTRVVGAPAMTTVDAGGFHTCGLTPTGAAYCWGGNLFGQQGTGSRDHAGRNEATPRPVAGGLTFTKIAAGFTHTCGIATSGATYCWGSNDYGELGNGSSGIGTYVPAPVKVVGSVALVDLSAGDRHTCGITADGAAYCWGNNAGFKLGTDTVPPSSGSPVPVPVSGGGTFRAIRAGGDNTCAITVEGSVYCWGARGLNLAPDGSVRLRVAPSRFARSLDIVELAEGNGAMCGVARDNAAYCWAGHDEAVPVRVSGAIPAVSMSPGRDRTCLVSTTGKIYCWGPGGVGGMGDGPIRGSDAPVLVSAPF
jgi:alpha-tubulin suppressor-like RCC1 family protein